MRNEDQASCEVFQLVDEEDLPSPDGIPGAAHTYMMEQDSIAKRLFSTTIVIKFISIICSVDVMSYTTQFLINLPMPVNSSWAQNNSIIQPFALAMAFYSKTYPSLINLSHLHEQ